MSLNQHIQNYSHEEKLRSLLVDLAGFGKKADIYTLFSMCNDAHLQSSIDALLERCLIEEYEVRVFNTDFTCYGVTRDGYEYLKSRSWGGQS